MSDAGPSKISLSLGQRKPAAAPVNGLKRSRAALHDDEDDETSNSHAQTVSHFDKAAGGAIDTSRPKTKHTPLVIAPQKNRDWKEAGRKRQKSGLPNGARDPALAGKNEAEIDALEAAKKPGFGLNISKRKEAEEIESMDAPAEADNDAPRLPTREKTDDERAMEALLGVEQKSDLVLPAVSEEEAFAQDFRTAPDIPTLDDYARVPVEQFGAALLRGMGWKEGEGVGSQRGAKAAKTKIPERRPALLGIGAKEDAAIASEMGAWGKAARKGAEVKIYNPVLLKDKKTGEMFTEEEWQQKKEKEERERYELEFETKEKERRRKRDARDDSRDRRRDRERHREPDRDRRRERDRDRDEDKHQRDRRRHDDSNEEYYRRKGKERRRRDRERDDSRERSRRYDHRDRSKDRHREKDRRHDRDRS